MNESNVSLAEAEQSFIDDFNELEDWFLQYEYLLAFVSDCKTLTSDEHNEENRIKGCQSNAWVVCERSGDKIFVRADADALIIKGILGVMVSLLSGRKYSEVKGYSPRFLDETALKDQLSTDRFRGMHEAFLIMTS